MNNSDEIELERTIERLNNFKTIKIMYGNTFAMHLEQLEQLQEDIGTVLNYVKNSMPKEAIEKKIEEYFEYDKKHKRYMSDGRECYTNEYYKALTLQELLEEK